MLLFSLLHRTGKGFAILTGQGEGGDDLLKQRTLQIAPDRLVLHALPDDIVSCQIGRQHHAGVAAVQDTNLLLLIGMVVRHELHRKPRQPGEILSRLRRQSSQAAENRK